MNFYNFYKEIKEKLIKGISLLVQVQEEATAKYKKMACFAFPFWFLIFGIFVYNVYLIATDDLLDHGEGKRILMFFGLSFSLIPVLCCCGFICGDADKVNSEIGSR